MKACLSITLVLFSVLLQLGAEETYSDSLGIAEFTPEAKIEWKKDDSKNEDGLGMGVGPMAKGTVVLLITIDKSKLDWTMKSYPDSLLEDFAEADDFKKARDITKKMDGGVMKRYVEAGFSKDGKKVKAYLLCAENDTHVACVMITCNKGGQNIKKGLDGKVLRTLKFM